MSDAYCTNCGSLNHVAFDCSKPRRAEPLPPPASLRGEDSDRPATEEPPQTAGRVHATPPLPALLPPPVWMPWAPQVCSATNLFAYKDDDELARFTKRIGPEGWKTDKKWKCEHCGLTHVRRHLDYATSGQSEVGKSPPFPDPGPGLLREQWLLLPERLRGKTWTPFVSKATRDAMAKRDYEAAGLSLQTSRTGPYATPTGVGDKGGAGAKAAVDNSGYFAKLRAKVLALLDSGWSGTSEQAAVRLKAGVDNVKPRFSELQASGHAEKSGHEGRWDVWRRAGKAGKEVVDQPEAKPVNKSGPQGSLF